MKPDPNVFSIKYSHNAARDLNLVDKLGSPIKARNTGVFKSERAKQKKQILTDDEIKRFWEVLNSPLSK